MTAVVLAEGTLFAGRYRITRRIAHGGMGTVYEALHVETERRRALKIMLPTMLQSPEMRERFRLEARVTAAIESEFIVDVLDAGVDEATQMPFLVMELLRGEELDKRLKRLGCFEPNDVLTYLHQVALALEKTHKASIVHRDLKPGNLFLTEREDGSPRIKVLDFGIAKLIAEGATGAAVTQTLGTPLYMAPEQFRVGQKVSPAADIFALGMIAYTLLVGVPYWQNENSSGANVYAFIGIAMHGPTESAALRAGQRGVSLPPGFDGWFAKATAAAPEARFPTALAAITALTEVFGAGSDRVSHTPTPGDAAVTCAETIRIGNTPTPYEAPRHEPPRPIAPQPDVWTPALSAELVAMPAPRNGGGISATPAENGALWKRASIVAAVAILGAAAGLIFFRRDRPAIVEPTTQQAPIVAAASAPDPADSASIPAPVIVEPAAPTATATAEATAATPPKPEPTTPAAGASDRAPKSSIIPRAGSPTAAGGTRPALKRD